MNSSQRIAVTALVTVVAYYASGWFGFLVWVLATARFGGSLRDDAAGAFVQSLCSLAGAALAGWYAWRRTGAARKLPPGVVASVLQWAFIIGGIGFALGFFGPIIFTPGANQGPLLGIFITGPLGFVVGGVVGLVRALRSRSQACHQPN